MRCCVGLLSRVGYRRPACWGAIGWSGCGCSGCVCTSCCGSRTLLSRGLCGICGRFGGSFWDGSTFIGGISCICLRFRRTQPFPVSTKYDRMLHVLMICDSGPQVFSYGAHILTWSPCFNSFKSRTPFRLLKCFFLLCFAFWWVHGVCRSLWLIVASSSVPSVIFARSL